MGTTDDTGGVNVADEVRQALEQGRQVQEAVRNITLKALTRGELDRDALRKVTADVIQGVQAAAAVQGTRATQAVAQAVAGVDEALAHTALALKLSLEEAAGRAEKFSREDLAKARENLKDIESLFLDALRETARASRGAGSAMLQDVLRHAEASGTAVGRQLAQMGELSGRMVEAGRARFAAGVDAALTSGAMMARMASGVLAGIAETLAEKSKGRPH